MSRCRRDSNSTIWFCICMTVSIKISIYQYVYLPSRMISRTLDFPFASKNSGWAANTPESIIITSTFFPVKLKSILPVFTSIVIVLQFHESPFVSTTNSTNCPISSIFFSDGWSGRWIIDPPYYLSTIYFYCLWKSFCCWLWIWIISRIICQVIIQSTLHEDDYQFQLPLPQ